MKTNGLKILAILLFFLIISISTFTLITTGIKQEQIISPCVDGDGDINVAGIMCDKLQTSFFGMPDNDQGFITILIILFGVSLLGVVASFILFLVYIFEEDKQ